MISTLNLKFSYGNKVQFQFPDISCQASNVLLITGASGVGKTTLLHLLSGLLKPSDGQVVIDESNLTNLSDAKLDAFRGQNIGIVLQQNHFVESFTVLENVVLASWLASGKHATENATAILTQLGLENQMKKFPSQLSVGQQQRVSIARALINNPKVILADEPTSSLDDENTIIVADLLQNIAKDFKTALIIVTHDSRLKNRFSNQITLS